MAKSFSAECWLACLAVFQLMSLSLTYFSSLVVIMLPFAVLGFVAVFVAIYLKWRRGIYIFIAFSAVLFVRGKQPVALKAESSTEVFAAVPFYQICFIEKKAATKPHQAMIYVFQMILQGMCIFYAIVVLNHDESETSEPVDDEENQGLLGKFKGMFGSNSK